jgi:hypothetical protein
VEKLIACGADVHAKTEDEQSALLAATTFGHTQVAKQLMEAGSSKRAAWMGVDASAAAEELGRASIVASANAVVRIANRTPKATSARCKGARV